MACSYFDWIDFYMEFADKLLEYKENRTELIEKIYKIYENFGDDIKLPVLDKDIDGNEINPTDIDPFSIYCLFNGQEGVGKRIRIIKEFKKEFSISSSVPTSLEGISTKPVRKLFYWFKEGYERPIEDIPNLWVLFEIALKYSENQEDNKENFIHIYNQVVEQKGIGMNFISMALNWIRPYVFFNSDKFTTELLKEKYSENISNIAEVLNQLDNGDTYLNLCNQLVDIFKNSEEYKNFPQFSSHAYRIEKRISPIDFSFINSKLPCRIKEGTNFLLYGVPGSGKSWIIKNIICKDVDEDYMERVVFHPDYTYSDFVGQILPKLTENEQVKYEFVCGPFTLILRKANKNPHKRFYLIIEEINRGNAPAIFGDIFQLLDRMEDGTSEFPVTNEYIADKVYEDKNEKVRIPPNLSIIATMNTSDQNVFTLDTAFQRRWSMKLIKNSFDDVKESFKNTKISNSNISWEAFCNRINEIILENNSLNLSFEDKRMGVYFVNEKELKDSEAFSEKVLKYLWDDAFKFNRTKLFKNEYKSLEDVISDFNNENKNCFDVFKDGLFETTIYFDTI